MVVWNKFGSESHEPHPKTLPPTNTHRDSVLCTPSPPTPSPQGLKASRVESGLHMSAKWIGSPACPHSYPSLWQGTPKLVVSSGGALYQPVTMVTSQGQVVTQAIPQGAIQIQNTQVSVCVQCRCVHMCMVWGRAPCPVAVC